MKILIDAGHGIDTPGKRSPDGSFLEYRWNRQMADLVIARLVSRGIDASLVVTETNDIPLRTRVMRVNKVCDQVGAKNVLLISIHANAAGMGKEWMNAKGWCCYTSPGKTGSDEFAECMYDSFTKAFPDRQIRRDKTDGDSDYEANFYMLTKSKCRAILLENFFYDNKEECQWLQSRVTQERIANASVVGILLYLSEP